MKRIRLLLQKWGKFSLLLLLQLITFTYAMFQGGFVSWFLFYSFLPFGLFAIILFLYPLSDFTLQRIISNKEVKAGDSVNMRIVLTRKYRFPLIYLFINEILPERIAVLTSREKVGTLVFPGFKKTLEISYTIKDMPRGDHVFNEIQIKTGDLLGLIEQKHDLVEKQTVLVYPEIIALPFKPIISDYEHGRRNKSFKLRRETAMVSGIRDYVNGDRMTIIDWKSSAKGLGLKTKNFEEKHGSDVLLIFHNISTHELFEEMVTFGASLFDSGIARNQQIGLWITHTEEGDWLPIRGGQSHRGDGLYRLAKLNNIQPEQYLTDTPTSHGRYIPKEASLILLTSILDMPLVKRYIQLAEGTRNLIILFFQSPSYRFSKSEEDAYIYGLNHGAKIKTIKSRSDWDTWKEGSRK